MALVSEAMASFAAEEDFWCLAIDSDCPRSALAVTERLAELSGKLKLADTVKTTAGFAEELSLMLLLTDRFWQNQTVCLSQDF